MSEHLPFCVLYLSTTSPFALQHPWGASHLEPVVKLVMGEVQLHHVGTEGGDVQPVPGFSDAAVTQHQCARQVQTVYKHNSVMQLSFGSFHFPTRTNIDPGERSHF